MKTHMPSFLSISLLIVGPIIGAEPTSSLKVFPAEIELRGQEDRQSVVIQAVDAQGITRDVTGQAKLRLADPKLGTISGQTVAAIARPDGTRMLDVGEVLRCFPVALLAAAS